MFATIPGKHSIDTDIDQRQHPDESSEYENDSRTDYRVWIGRVSSHDPLEGLRKGANW
jgi:hypothetical protein